MTTALAHFASVPKAQRSQVDYILLDGSGSMSTKWWDMMDAIQGYVDGIKREGVNTHLTLQVFDHNNLDLVERDCDLKDWKSCLDEPIRAYFGGSPVYDAINLMCRKLRDADPARCSILIVTDGDANGVQHTDLNQAKALLDWCRAKGWQVTFIGAEFDNSDQARMLGADKNSAIGVTKAMLTSATSALAKKRARYGLYGENMHYTEEEQTQFGGYLGHG